MTDQPNGEREYWRGRATRLEDDRYIELRRDVGGLNKKVDAIDSKLDRIAGALAILMVLANLLSPWLRDILAPIARAAGQ